MRYMIFYSKTHFSQVKQKLKIQILCKDERKSGVILICCGDAKIYKDKLTFV